MAKENKVLMRYEARGIDEILYLGNRIQTARKNVSEKHKDDISLKLNAKKDNSSNFLEFNLEFIGANKESLEDALKQFFSIIGLPSLFYNNSNYELVNKILENYGKRLKRDFSDFSTFLIGKKVVNKFYTSNAHELSKDSLAYN